ncbi:unnamed protein product [Calicophoron daubneyi]|uniref:Mitochondrial transcription rescue factor 1 C-terminal domain-containing protein n=1 Tax=Calicophoron daubneyi TaxID=300641 RepID=A0AAV2TZH6_CALDB
MRVLVGLATLMLNGFVRASVPVLSRRVCYHNSLFQRPGTHKFVRFASRRHRKQNSDSDDSSDSDSDESDDEVYDQDENDPYYEEDVAFSPQFRQLTTHVKALRYDKVLRAGLNLTRATVEDAFFASRLRLNGQVLLKKATVVDEGDKLDLVLSEEVGVVGKRVRVLHIHAIRSDSYKISLRCWRSRVKI